MLGDTISWFKIIKDELHDSEKFEKVFLDHSWNIFGMDTKKQKFLLTPNNTI